MNENSFLWIISGIWFFTKQIVAVSKRKQPAFFPDLHKWTLLYRIKWKLNVTILLQTSESKVKLQSVCLRFVGCSSSLSALPRRKTSWWRSWPPATVRALSCEISVPTSPKLDSWLTVQHSTAQRGLPAQCWPVTCVSSAGIGFCWKGPGGTSCTRETSGWPRGTPLASSCCTLGPGRTHRQLAAITEARTPSWQTLPCQTQSVSCGCTRQIVCVYRFCRCQYLKHTLHIWFQPSSVTR